MNSKDLLKFSLLIAALSGVVFNLSLITFLLFLLAIFLNTKSKIKFRYILIITSIYALFFNVINQKLHNQLPKQESLQKISLTVYPDEIMVDGDNLKLVGTNDANHQKMVVYSRIENLKTQKRLKNNQSSLQFLIEGQPSQFDLPTNQYQFNSREYNFRNSITAKIDQAKIIEINRQPKLNAVQFLVGSIRTIRVKLIDFFNRLPKNLAEYCQTLIVGYLPLNFYQENNGLIDLGLIHLFTISGFHVGYLIKLIFRLFRKVLTAKTINLLSSLALIAFYLLSGDNPVLLRAILAGEIILFANLFQKKIDSYLIWSLSLLLTLILAPQILLTSGGQLSFLLTFAILWTGKLNNFKANLLLSLVTVPIILSTHFVWHLLSVPINFLVIPFFGTVILPVVFLGLFCYRIPLIVNLADQIIYLFNQGIGLIAKLPGQIIFGELNRYLIIPLVFLMILIFTDKYQLKKLAATLVLTILIGQYCLNHIFAKGELTFFDIGQGDSILIKQPANQNVTLIDTGGQLEFNNQDWRQHNVKSKKGETIIVNYLHAKGISKIDQLVLTHQDQDHIGYANQILDSVDVKSLLIPDGMQNTAAFKEKILPYLNQTEVVLITDQSKIEAPFLVLHPFTSGQAENQDSIAIAAKIGNLNFFSAGDLDQEGEQEILKKYPKLKFDIVKLGHHGSKTSSNFKVLEKFEVKYAIISAGRNNRYGHPHPETLSTLQRLKTINYNTQTNGMIKFEFTERDLNQKPLKITTAFNNFSNENQSQTITR